MSPGEALAEATIETLPITVAVVDDDGVAVSRPASGRDPTSEG